LTSPGVPEALRRKVLSWISGGAAADDSVPEARLIAAAMIDFVLRLPAPKRITDDQLRGLDIPVLAIVAGSSVMLDAPKAAAHARAVLQRGQVEVWADASHALNGEFPDRIAERAHRFWDEADS
jgi:pimeloyl-ACP methyl ester carboxylesterase